MKRINPLPFLCIISLFYFLKGAPTLAYGGESCISVCLKGSFYGMNGNMEFIPPADLLTDTGQTDFTDIVVSAAIGRPKPGFIHFGAALIENNSVNNVSNVNVVIKYDSLALLLSSNYTPFYSSPGYLTFFFDTIMAFEKKNILLEFELSSDSASLGHLLWIEADVPVFSSDINWFNNKDNCSNKVTGSFDPNAKAVVPEGFGSENYVPVSQEEFKYTIHFQNTGTDTAINITLIDTISPYLDPFSIMPGASSHPFSWEILSPGIVKFHFINIYLPDSNTNEARSHGFVCYTINALPGLAVGVNIKNTAFILFDFNDPVATNTTANELYDCNNIASFSLSQSVLCGGDSLLIVANTLVPHSGTWYLDTSLIAIGDSFIFTTVVAGNHVISFEAQTPFCSQITAWPINVVIPDQPTIIQNGANLISSVAPFYQWVFNGLAIPNEQWVGIVASQTGWYQVITTDINGCKSISDSVYVFITSVNGEFENTILQMYPNPVMSEINVFVNIDEKATIKLVDSRGRLVLSEIKEAGRTRIKLNTKTLDNGIYFMQITGKSFSAIKMISKQ